MSDRTVRLGVLQKLTGDGSIEELEKRTMLNLSHNRLTSLPLGIWDLPRLLVLGLWQNQISSLPPEISQLSGLTWLHVGGNQLTSLPQETWQLTGLISINLHKTLIEELPPQITALTNLQYLQIEHEGEIYIKRAPHGIMNLPCWNNTRKFSGMTLSYGDALRRLKLYDVVNIPAKTCNDDEPRKDPNSEPVTGDYADVMEIDFSSLQFLGKGGFGMAYKAQLKKGTVAIKVLKTEAKPGTPEYEELTTEAKMMVNLRHENIIGLYAFGCKSLKVFYVMEFADGNSIWDIIGITGALPFEKFIKYSIHMNSGLRYLHSQTPPVEHRDLKPENVLLCNGVAKICDFGISSARETVSRTTGFQGTFHYAAPEYFDTMKGYGPMSDIYSFALVIWAMAEGKRPYDGLTIGQVSTQKLQQRMPKMPPTTPAKLASLMNCCWNYEPRNRPSAVDMESRLTDVQMNPGAPVGEKESSVKDMNTAELVNYLEGKKVHEDFVTAIKENDMNGEDFLELEEKDLVAVPFFMKKVQIKIILKIINEAKRT